MELYREGVSQYPYLQWQASGGVRDASDLTALAKTGVAGAVSGKALLEEHILFDIVTPRNLADIGKYKVIVLPNTACMSQREVDAIRVRPRVPDAKKQTQGIESREVDPEMRARQSEAAEAIDEGRAAIEAEGAGR